MCARVARRTRAVYSAVNRRTTQAVVAAYGCVAQIDERVTASSRVTLKENKQLIRYLLSFL